ncbi:MAG TPA: hypothetical protein VFL17_19375 [Anaerolineae bacterium]|nr:hypothetical protein [Anaerolineae bacterium]
MRPLWQILTRAASRASPNCVLACDECFVALEYLAELLDADVDPKDLWHAAQRHLARCPDCREHHRQRIHDLEARLVESSRSRL